MTSSEAEPAPSPASPMGVSRVVVIEILVAICVAVLPDLCSALAPRPTGYHYTTSMLALRLLPRSIAVSAVLLYFIWRSELRWSDFGICRFRVLPDVFGAALAAVAAYLAYCAAFWGVYLSLGARLYRDLLTHSTPSSSLFLGPRLPIEYLLMVLTQLCNGFAEELAVRGYLITRFRQLLRSRAGALLLSSALFASYHAYQGAIGVMSAFAIGLTLGAIFLRFKRLWPVVGAHALLDMYWFLRLK